MTKLFVCDSCQAVDSLDLTPQRSAPPYQCAECLTGNWHHHFPKRPYDPAHDQVVNRINPTAGDLSISLG